MSNNGTIKFRFGPEGRHMVYYALPDSLDTLSLGDFLRTIRLIRRESLRDVAKAIDSSHGYLGKIEDGKVKSEPTLGMLKRLADHYGLHTDSLLEVAGLRSRDGQYR